MADNSTVDDLTIADEEDGIETVKELDKKVLTKGGPWVTLMFRYQEWNASKEEYSDDKFTIRRYQKRDGKYRQKSKFNISSVDQAKSMIEILQGWTTGEGNHD